MNYITLTVTLIVTVTLILLAINSKENFIIDVYEEDRLKLQDTKINDLVKEIDTNNSFNHSFFNVNTKYPLNLIAQNDNNKNDKNDKNNEEIQSVKAYNDDFKYTEKKSQIKNVIIDKGIVNILSNIKDTVIDTSLSELKEVNLQDNPAFNIVTFVDKEEVRYIVAKFIEYINKITKYMFSSLEISKTELLMSSNKGELSKKYKVFLYIYENSITYVKRLEVNFLTHQYPDKKGIVKIENIVIPKDADLSNISLLPPMSKTFYKIENKLGLTLPYKTSEFDMMMSEEQFNKELERRRNIDKLRKEYSCFGIPQNELISSKEECLNFGGVWDRPVEDNSLCPFYQKNKNYLNNRGGSKGDYCEMPSGIEIKGFSKFNKDPDKYRPICYNCKTDLIGQGTMGNCCEKQQTDKINYPQLKSPDYKYPGDQLDRYNSKNQLISLGLNFN